MTTEQKLQVIAEYMGTSRDSLDNTNYNTDWNALIEVWKKLGYECINIPCSDINKTFDLVFRTVNNRIKKK